MKIVFLSNYFNHHQKSLCDSLNSLSDEFVFVSTSKMREERVKLGYQNIEASYVIHIDDDKGRFLANPAIKQADAVIIGSAPEELIAERIKSGGLIFRYCERLMKKPFGTRFLPEMIRWRKRNPKSANIYLLCAGAYTAGDFARFGLFRDRAFKWGYFPTTKSYESIENIVDAKKKNSILWAGRLIDWKHPEMAIESARYLKNKGIDYSMELVGSGDMEDALNDLISEYGLEKNVRISGSVTPSRVRELMEQSEIFLFTSDRQEGWGAVLNEAMNSGCAVVASDEIGAVPFLMRNGENGFVFESGNTQMMCIKLEYLINTPKKRRELGLNAYSDITQMWNAEEAAKRLITLTKALQDGKDVFALYREGPCSKAEAIV